MWNGLLVVNQAKAVMSMTVSDSVIQDYFKEEINTVTSLFTKHILPLISDEAASSVLFCPAKLSGF